jgi:hypothetical protein
MVIHLLRGGGKGEKRFKKPGIRNIETRLYFWSIYIILAKGGCYG